MLRPFALFVAVSLAGACSSTPSQPAGPPSVRFVSSAAVPNFMDVPFPSDAYLQGGHVGTIPALDAVFHENASFLQHALSSHDGFGRFEYTAFYVDDPAATANDDGSVAAAQVDTATLPGSETASVADASSVFLVQLDAADAAKARIPCRATYHVAPLAKTRPLLGIAPGRGIVLDGGHPFAAVVTSRVKDKSGKAITQSADFAKLATGDRSAPLGALYGGALDKVNGILGGALGADKVVGLAVFTTNTMERELYSLRDQLEDVTAPALAWDANAMAPMGAVKFAHVPGGGNLPAGFTASTDDWLGLATKTLPNGDDDPDALLDVQAHNKIDAVGTAVFQGINYLNVRPNGYADPDHANFARDASGKVIPAPEQPTVKIWVTFFLPDAATMPAGGFPVVIVQHGLSSSRHWSFNLANTLCSQGWAVAAIDSVTFGARAPEPQFQVDQHSMWSAASGSKANGTYDGPDGLADLIGGSFNGSADLFGTLLNIGALRDQLRQAAFDTTQLAHILRSNPDMSPLKTGTTVPKIDGTRVAYLGDSLGGIEGATATAIEPQLAAWVLEVAGGGVVSEIATRSPVISLSLGVGGVNFGFVNDQFTDAHLASIFLGTITEPGDPLLYASHIVTAPAPLKTVPTKPRNVLQVEVLFDELVTNEGDEALARAAGYGLATPNVGSNAEISDLKNPDANPRKVPLANVDPDSNGGIHDTPIAGTTAVVIQVGPGTHGSDLVQSKGDRTYAAPWGLFDTFTAFPKAPAVYKVSCPYREIQATIVGFLGTAFAGGVPVVKGFKPPVRDLDDDGTPDAIDPDPNDPTKK